MAMQMQSIPQEFGSLLCQARHITVSELVIFYLFIYLAIGLYKCGSFEDFLRTQLDITSAKGYGIHAIASLMLFAMFFIILLTWPLCN